MNTTSGRRDGIFISYRRNDTQGWAFRLAATFTRLVGDVPLFIDLVSIDAGRDFVASIERALASSRVLLALIGPHWRDGDRLADLNDMVRLEIANALQREILVVPVLLGGARVPNPADLPDVLRSLLNRQAFELRDNVWDADCERLARQITGRLNAPPPQKSPRVGVATRMALRGSSVGNIVGIERDDGGALQEYESLDVASEAHIENSSVADIVGVRITSRETQPK